MDFFPLFLDLKGQSVLLVGGAASARNKMELLLKAQAQVVWVTSKVDPSLLSWCEHPSVTWHNRLVEAGDLKKKKLVYVACEDQALAQQVYQWAKKRDLPINVVDQPDLCSFITPSLIDRSPLLIAVSSSGVCPRLSRLVRAKLETLIPQSYSRLALLLGGFRAQVRAVIDSPESRRRFWDKLFNSPLIEMFLSGQEEGANQALQQTLADHPKNRVMPGEVCLVGAGPGDPDLLTLRALRLIQNADIIVYDRLVSPKILDFARREAKRIYVGKKAAEHTMAQDQINQTLVNLAQEGNLVVRLKGGDPFIFGRGGEELEELADMGVNFQVVPGVSAASGCGVYAGIPLTHRDFAQSVRFVTGHSRKEGALELDWASLASPQQTLVFYMGLSTLGRISHNLMDQGMDPKTPVGLIEKGTTYQQRLVTTCLDEAAEVAIKEKLEPPTLVIVGQVVSLAEKLHWFHPQKITNPAKAVFQQP